MTKYLLDANVFIQAHRQYYPFDVCPGFWKALLVHHDKNRVFSIDRVKKEIEDGTDRLKTWANEHAPESFFKKTADKTVVDWFAKTIEWVYAEAQFTPAAKTEYANAADGWLVAYAKSNGFVVVTQEVYNPEIKKKVPIPNVCREFAVKCDNTVAMLRALKVQMGLRKRDS